MLEVPEYKVHASRRIEPGLAEIHERETDVIYALQGEASFVTGGRLLDGKATAPGEIRGSKLAGGTARRLVPGDLLIVPRRTPHLFRDIHLAPFVYFVVKPIAPAGGAHQARRQLRKRLTPGRARFVSWRCCLLYRGRRIVDGKLYLNFSREAKALWEKAIHENIASANWPRLNAH